MFWKKNHDLYLYYISPMPIPRD